jgi:hypothetical protein
MYCNQCGQETNNPRLCDECNESSLPSNKKLSDIDINALSEKLVHFGILTCVLCFAWWTYTYSFAEGNILNFTRCLYSNDAMCSLAAVFLNGTNDSITYNSTFLWIGVISLIIGKIIQPNTNARPVLLEMKVNVRTKIIKLKNKILYSNYEEQKAHTLSYIKKNKLKTLITALILISCIFTLYNYYEYYTMKSNIKNGVNLTCNESPNNLNERISRAITKNTDMSISQISGLKDGISELVETCPKDSPLATTWFKSSFSE